MLAKFGNVTTFCRKFSGKKFPVQKSYDMSQNFATRNFRIANFLSRFCKLCLKLSTKIPVTHFLTEMCTRNPSRNFVPDLQILHGNVRNSGIPGRGGTPPGTPESEKNAKKCKKMPKFPVRDPPGPPESAKKCTFFRLRRENSRVGRAKKSEKKRIFSSKFPPDVQVRTI